MQIGQKWYTEVIYNMIFDITCHAIEKPIWPVISGKQCYPFHPIPAQFIQPYPTHKIWKNCHPKLCQSRLRRSSWPWRSESAATWGFAPLKWISSNLAHRRPIVSQRKTWEALQLRHRATWKVRLQKQTSTKELQFTKSCTLSERVDEAPRCWRLFVKVRSIASLIKI